MQLAHAVEAVADYTTEQWGMVTSAQAKAVGVDGVTLLRMVDAGLLERVRRACYLVTAAAQPVHVQERAAWLLLNPAVPAWERPRLDPAGGVVSHSSAALIHDIGDLLADTIEITVPRRRGTREPDLKLRLATLDENDVTLVEGLPVTTVERTIIDHLADHHDGGHIGQMIHHAVRADQLDVDSLAARVGVYNRRYALKGRDGRELIDYLLDQGGDLTEDLAEPRLPHRHSIATGLLAALAGYTEHKTGSSAAAVRGGTLRDVMASLKQNDQRRVASLSGVPLEQTLARILTATLNENKHNNELIRRTLDARMSGIEKALHSFPTTDQADHESPTT